MNLFLISLLDTMVERNIELFIRMNFVKSALYLSDLHQLSSHLQALAEFYFKFLQQINLLPAGVFKIDYMADLEEGKPATVDPRITKILSSLNVKDKTGESIIPVHLRFSDPEHVHLVAGIMKFENGKITFVNLVDLHIPKNIITTGLSYIREIFELYRAENQQSVKDFIKVKGYCYNQFQKDCKTFFGDTFYSFIQKKKIMDAVDDIIFTSLSFKEIAFKNRFVDYPNMYKTFSKYGIPLPSVPRLASL